MSLPWKRMYVDIPRETHDKLKILAVKRGMSQKGLVAELIETAVKASKVKSKPARSKRKTTKKRGTKRGKR